MVNDIIKLLNEAFSSANKRYYQRRQDERIKEMRAAGFDPSGIVDEVNPNSQSLAKAEREFAKFLENEKKNKLNQKDITKNIDDIDTLYDELEAKDPDIAGSVHAEYQIKVKEIGQAKASEWFRSELLKKLDKSIVSGGETWDDEMTKDFSNSPITKGDFPDPIGDRRSNMDVSNVPAKPSNSGSNEKVKHLIIAFKKYMNAGREDAGGTNKDAELMSFFDHLINSGDIDVDAYTLGEAFPNVNREDYSDQQWKVANARAIQRVKNANIPELREILSKIMDRSDDELAELKEDIVIESSSGIVVIAAGTKILIESTGGVRILSIETTDRVINNPGKHLQVCVQYEDGMLKDAMAAAMRVGQKRGYNKSPKFGSPERREDGLVTYFTFTN
jgi:DNA-binding transcriptional MerR regulator